MARLHLDKRTIHFNSDIPVSKILTLAGYSNMAEMIHGVDLPAGGCVREITLKPHTELDTDSMKRVTDFMSRIDRAFGQYPDQVEAGTPGGRGRG